MEMVGRILAEATAGDDGETKLETRKAKSGAEKAEDTLA